MDFDADAPIADPSDILITPDAAKGPLRISVIGLGLIGGSIAQSLHRSGHRVMAYDVDDATMQAASQYGIALPTRPADLYEADIVFVCVPYHQLKNTLSKFRHKTTDDIPAYNGILTDTGSIKGQPARWMRPHPHFIGGHPMAGKETDGWDSADPNLFYGAKWVLCPEDNTNLADWTTLARVILTMGAFIVPATAELHDNAVARTSHLQHLLAAAITHLSAQDPLAMSLAAGSFRDATRVAASSPDLVDGMVRGNMKQIAFAMADFSHAMGDMSNALRDDLVTYTGRITEYFAEAHELRTNWPPEPMEAEDMEITLKNLQVLGAGGGWVEDIDVNGVAVVRRPTLKSTS